ncbi:MAG TPA: S8 family serine peptidase [Pirellulaceae bacterium]|nr:S8 family serine peptidase [Pirellulaceae bacterium]
MFETLEDRRVLAAFPAPVESWEQAEFFDNEVLFKTNGSLTFMEQTELDMFLNLYAADVVQAWDELSMAHVKSGNNWTRSETIAFAKSLHELSFVEYAEPNLMYHKSVIPNDPLFGLQWGLHNVGQLSPYPPPNIDPFAGVFDADIDAPEAWDTITGDPDTVIAIIDTGVDYTHPDLAANIWRNPNEIPDGFDNDGNGFVDDIVGWDTFDNDNDPQDEQGHGTHVAGIMGAVGNNAVGVTGVSWNSKILPIKASNAGGAFSTAAIVGAQVYITRMKTQFGVNIVASNNSYGATGAGAFSFAQFDAIRLATNAGIAFIAAAGNDGVNTDAPTTPTFPAGYNLPGVISVAATDRTDTLAAFSNRGFFSVDLAAPGVAILSTASTLPPPLGPGLLPGQPPAPNIPPPGYGWLSGTSMASPMVAGAYAVIKAFDPQLTVAQVKNLLLTTVDVIPSLQNVTVSGGRLNLANAIDAIPVNEFRGTVFADLDGDGRFDSNESGLSGWTVYADLNNNQVRDPGEPATVSGANGDYTLRAKLLNGTYFIREVVQPGWTQTFPGQQSQFAHQVTVTSGTQVFNDLDFGNKPTPGSVVGVKYNDLNGNGQRDSGEPGLEGFVIYADMNNDGRIGVGEPASVTDANGRFQINNIIPGPVVIREIQRPGFLQTEPDPSGPLQGGIGVVVVGGTVTGGLVFGNRAAHDWGDAPASYGTLKADNGPSHGLLPGFFLGDASDTTVPHIDDEPNGIPSANADGDDLDNFDDEDGVSFLTPLVPGQNATIRVDVSSGAYGSGILQGWIDFNNDGDFFDAGEQILTDKVLVTGSHLFTFAVPSTAAVGDTFARFRWSLQRGLGPTGPATAGEVEDYSTSARAVSPTANDDGPFIVGADSNFIDNVFDVLANDFPGVDGDPFFILSADATSAQGGLVQVDFVNQVIRYQPPADYIGPDSFEYIISDGIHPPSLPGTVFIDVVPLDPVAIDDSFNINFGSASVPLDVLANDIQGVGGPLDVVAIGPRSAGGTAIYNATTKRIVYTPPSPTFQGADLFTYTISGGVQANVHVQVGGPAASQIVQIEYRALNSQGQELGTPGVPAPAIGDTITLAAFTKDLRGQFADPIFPALFPDASGVLSAYADVLYDRSIVRPVPANNPFGIDITFGLLYPDFRSATSALPGIVDEAGANTSQSFEYALSDEDNLLFTIKFNVRANGTFRFFANPEEDSAQFTFETQVHSTTTGQPIVISNSEIFFKHSLPIQIGPNPEGEATNLFNPLDVNQDTFVTPNDAMLVVNHLNRFGAGPYSPMLAAATGQGVPQYFLDVNSDGRVSAFDAKLVVDYLNLKATQARSSASSPEGEADDSIVISQSLGSTTVSSSSSSSSTSDADDESAYASDVDQLLGDDLVGSAVDPVVAEPSPEQEDMEGDEHDDIFADWESA